MFWQPESGVRRFDVCTGEYSTLIEFLARTLPESHGTSWNNILIYETTREGMVRIVDKKILSWSWKIGQ